MADTIDHLSVKIALLSLVTNLPEQRSTNTSSQYLDVHYSQSQSSKTIAFKHEVLIAQQLAFICAYSDDPLHVLATCIEENHSKHCLIIRLAANTGTHGVLLDGLRIISGILQNEALNGLTSSMTTVSSHSQVMTVNRNENQEALFKAVVSVNQRRILSRIRSRHATSSRAKNKVPLSRRLLTVKTILQSPSTCNTRMKSLIDCIDRLQGQFDTLEKMNSIEARSSSSEQLLGDLVKDIHSLVIEHEHDVKLVPYTPGLWNGNATESLIDRLGKLSHYVKACEDLLRAARRYDIFSNIAIEFVNLQQKGRRLSEKGLSSYDKVIEASCSEKILSQISNQQSISIAAVRERIKPRLLEKSRVHAEIQLVVYYEENNILFRPRVICSSKSACYLCHLFFKLHGRYLVPSTHGKLYDTWRWPVSTLPGLKKTNSLPQLDIQHILPQLSNSIDRKISQLLQCTGPTSRVEPAESRVDILAAMTPSILSRISQHSESLQSVSISPQKTVKTAMGIIDDEVEEPSIASRGTTEGQPPLHQTLSLGIETPKQDSEYNNEEVALDRATPSQCEVKQSLRGRAATWLQQLPLKLQAGDIITHSFDVNNACLKVEVPGLYLDLQYEDISIGQNQLGGEELRSEEKSFDIQVECLRPSTNCHRSDLVQAIDLEEGDWLEKSVAEGILFSAEGLLLKKGSVMLRLRAQSDGPPRMVVC